MHTTPFPRAWSARATITGSNVPSRSWGMSICTPPDELVSNVLDLLPFLELARL
jgi:hypothetical protein